MKTRTQSTDSAGRAPSLAAALLAACLCAGAVCAQQTSPAAGNTSGQGNEKGGAQDATAQKLPVKKYGVVWEGKLSRSANPKSDAGWLWLRGRGVRSVVNFRNDNDVDYRGLGFGDVLWIPLKSTQIPTDEEAERFLAFIQDPARQPVHVYCSEGKDRTGMMIALARYAVDGWPVEDAIAEARRYRRGEDLAPERLAWLREWAARHKPGGSRRR